MNMSITSSTLTAIKAAEQLLQIILQGLEGRLEIVSVDLSSSSDCSSQRSYEIKLEYLLMRDNGEGPRAGGSTHMRVTIVRQDSYPGINMWKPADVSTDSGYFIFKNGKPLKLVSEGEADGVHSIGYVEALKLMSDLQLR